MECNCNELTDENEINIIEKYNNNAKRYTIICLCKIIFVTGNLSIKLIFKRLSVFVIFIGFTLIFYGFWPQISDLLFPINGTRSHPSLPFMIEYFVNQEKYFYMILFHANATLIIGSTAMLATGTIMIVCQKHACGMFRITRYENKYKNRCTKS